MAIYATIEEAFQLNREPFTNKNIKKPKTNIKEHLESPLMEFYNTPKESYASEIVDQSTFNRNISHKNNVGELFEYNPYDNKPVREKYINKKKKRNNKSIKKENFVTSSVLDDKLSELEKIDSLLNSIGNDSGNNSDNDNKVNLIDDKNIHDVILLYYSVYL